MEIKITNQNFTKLIEKENVKAVVDFWASWCGPCKMIAPEIEKLATSLPDLTVGKVNVDEEGELAQKFNIQAIPTILYFENGKLKDKIVGLVSYNEIVKKFGL